MWKKVTVEENGSDSWSWGLLCSVVLTVGLMEAEGLMHRKGEESISLLRALYVCLFEESNYLNIIKTFVYPYTYRGVCVA